MVLQASDVEIGVWDSATKTFTVTGTSPNAVRVTARRTTARGTPIPTVFAKVFGRTSVDLTYTSIAMSAAGNPPVFLHRFDETSGATAYDSESPQLNLTVGNPSNISWTSGSIQFNSQTKASSNAGPHKVHTRLMATNRLTVVGQVRFSNTTQTGPARIITLSTDTGNRNFTLGQQGQKFVARLRSTGGGNPGDSNGMPEMLTGDVITSTTHNYAFAMVYNGSTLRIRWKNLNNGSTGSTSVSRSGTFANWNTSYRLIYGDEDSNDRPWLGRNYHTAAFDVALTDSEIDDYWNGNYYPLGSSSGGSGVATVK
jgi:hypothetical protein